MNNTPTEYQECLTLADYLSFLKLQGKVLVYSHTAQSTWTKSWLQKMKNKRLGVTPGVPDYLIVTHGKVLAIEMKRVRNSRVSKSQKQWIKSINQSKKCEAFIAKGFDEAKEIIDKNVK